MFFVILQYFSVVPLGTFSADVFASRYRQ